MNKEVRVIVIGAHPDEPDIYAGGTAALFAELGHRVKFLSLTNGCCGHYEINGMELVERRRNEAAEAARKLGIDEYEVLDTPDGELLPTIAVRNEVVRQIRNWGADVVITFHPEGGAHSDNRYAGKVVSDAVPFVAKTPNAVPDAPALNRGPVVLLMPDYSMKSRYSADIVIDIEPVLEKKLLACDAHASQFYEFAPWQAGFLDQVPESWEDKKAFLLKYWAEFMNVSKEMKPALGKWYGAENAEGIRYAEPFEIAGYGRRPSDDEMKALFPMLDRSASEER
ncbi:PIG-L deacetylase family protein [Cohnella cholangitidis]|uniref:PIG-L family deacetylase n=1 Tax=Cohnella cholangitidis TaxID=2598458 RepID=A0A7G5BZX6_9BACL|nr:PIG-L deacetylase family protein [Cohnella cholangitidis]QMV42510.1 PIG-L family deacetylase [Cohnella cholangitidis]